MLFDTPVFLVFLVVVVLVYWKLGFHAQNRFLLAASFFFYAWWDWRFLCLMIGSTIIDYLIATKFPAMSLGPEHHGTAVGGLVNLALTLALLFWPSGHYEEQAPDSGGSFRMPDNPLRGRETASAATSRIARVANGEFGHR